MLCVKWLTMHQDKFFGLVTAVDEIYNDSGFLFLAYVKPGKCFECGGRGRAIRSITGSEKFSSVHKYTPEIQPQYNTSIICCIKKQHST